MRDTGCGQCGFRRLLLLALLAAAVAWPFATTPALAQSEESRRVVLRFLTTNDFPPFNFIDEDGALTGFNVHLARAICLKLAVTCDVRVEKWQTLFAGLNRGQADAVVAAHVVTPDALKHVDFTARYFHTPGRFVARVENSGLDCSPEGLDGRTVAVAKGTAHEAYLKHFFRDSKIVAFASPELAREVLRDGKVDALFGDGISLAFWLNGYLSRRCCTFVGGAYFEPAFFGDGIAIAVRKNEPELKRQLDSALRQVRESGRMRELVDRFFPFAFY